MSPPVRATALLKPDAMATCCSSTEPRTEEVSGATAIVIPSAMHEDRREGAGPIAAVRPASATPAASRAPTTSGPTVSGRRGPDARGEAAHCRRAAAVIRIGSGSSASPASHRRIAAAGDQHIGDQQHRRAECAVEQEGEKVEAREAAAGEQRERHHRPVAAAIFDDRKRDQQAGAERRPRRSPRRSSARRPTIRSAHRSRRRARRSPARRRHNRCARRRDRGFHRRTCSASRIAPSASGRLM